MQKWSLSHHNFDQQVYFEKQSTNKRMKRMGELVSSKCWQCCKSDRRSTNKRMKRVGELVSSRWRRQATSVPNINAGQWWQFSNISLLANPLISSAIMKQNCEQAAIHRVQFIVFFSWFVIKFWIAWNDIMLSGLKYIATLSKDFVRLFQQTFINFVHGVCTQFPFQPQFALQKENKWSPALCLKLLWSWFVSWESLKSFFYQL